MYKEHESVTIQNENISDTMVACTILTTMDGHRSIAHVWGKLIEIQ